MEPVILHEWATQHIVDSSLFAFDAAWNQVLFVQDHLIRRLHPDADREKLYPAMVIATHISKSQWLPVYELRAPGLVVIMRCNFYDWKVTVRSDREITCDFGDLFDPDARVMSYYCEGFRPEWVKEPYSRNCYEFTAELKDKYDLDVFLFLIGQQLGLRT